MPQQLFRGYVNTKDKMCMMPFKGVPDGDLLTFNAADRYPEFAGILAKNTILIDIDDAKQSEILMNIVEQEQLDCRVNATTRGRHFFFMNDKVEKCSTHVKLACGLTADIKVGVTNSYAILKYNNEHRFCEWDVEDDWRYQPLPKWLRPISGTIPDFRNLGEGDGRNDTLYRYILTLIRNGFNKDEARQCINIINDYILPTPLDQSELDVILRDEAFPDDMWKVNGKFSHADFGDYLISEHKIVCIGGMLYIYRDGIYVSGTIEIERAMISEYRNITPELASKVLWYIRKQAPDASTGSDDYVAFNNGIYDISNDVLLPFTPDIVLLNKIPWNYNPNSYDQGMDKLLDRLTCNDKDIRAVIEEMVGYCFYRRNDLSKSFILLGDKSNGKTTFIKILQVLLGNDNYTAMDLNEIGKQFSLASIGGKLANIGDDISDEFMNPSNVSNFKKIVSGAAMKAEVKYDAEMKTIKPYCKLIFSANEIPRMKDNTGAVLRRLVIIPFNAFFSKDDDDFDPYIYFKMIQPEPIQYLIQLGLKGLRRVIAKNDFTECASVNAELVEYDKSNNPIIGFLEDAKVINEPTSDCYTQYTQYCILNGFTAMSSMKFSKDVCSRLNLVTESRMSGGKRFRIFVSKENPDD